MTPEELKEWNSDASRSDNIPQGFFPGGPLIRSLLRTSAHISGVSQRMGYLTSAVRETLNKSIKELNQNIEKANESSTKLSKALNRLTLVSVIIAALGFTLLLVQFLYTNHIWPFS